MSPLPLPQPDARAAAIDIARAAAVDVARSWTGTPYVLGGRVRGAGCDCATLLAEYLIACGLAEREAVYGDLGLYGHDWFCHASDDRYMMRLLRHAPRALDGVAGGTRGALPGSLVLFRVVGSRLWNHGGIVTRWPFMVHAMHPAVSEQNCATHWMTGRRDLAIFDPWAHGVARASTARPELPSSMSPWASMGAEFIDPEARNRVYPICPKADEC